MKSTNKLFLLLSFIVIFCFMLSIGISAEEAGIGADSAEFDEAAIDAFVNESESTDESVTPSAPSDETQDGLIPDVAGSENVGDALLLAIDEHSGEILSLFAFIGSIILALVYKLGLAPLIRGALSTMLNSLGVLKESVAKSDEKCSGALTILEERIGATEDMIKRLDLAIATASEQIKAEEHNVNERADMRLIMQMQINMLYDIFMTSALPQYEKDAVGERISAMNKILTDRANEEKALDATAVGE